MGAVRFPKRRFSYMTKLTELLNVFHATYWWFNFFTSPPTTDRFEYSLTFLKNIWVFLCVWEIIWRELFVHLRGSILYICDFVQDVNTQCYRVALLFHILCSILFLPLSTISWEEEEWNKGQLQSRLCTQSCTTFPLQHSVVQRKYSWASLGKKTSLAISERYSAIP